MDSPPSPETVARPSTAAVAPYTPRDSAHCKLAGGHLQAPHHQDFNLSEAYTLMAWVRQDNTDARLFDKNTPGTIDGFNFDVFHARLRLCAAQGCFTATEPIPPNTYLHAAVTFYVAPYGPARFRDATGHGVRFYINGKRVDAESYPIKDTMVNTLPLTIGADSRGGNMARGYFDEMAVWKRAINHEEVLASLRGSAADVPHDLVAYWPVSEDEVGGIMVRDAVGGHDLEVVGFAAVEHVP